MIFRVISAVQRWPRPSLRRWRQGLILGAITALIILPIFLGNLFPLARNWLINALYTPAPTSDQIAIIAMDDKSLTAYGYAAGLWSRKLHADVLSTLSRAGARVVVFDVLFDGITNADEALSQAMTYARDNGTRTVVAVAAQQSMGMLSTPGEPIRYSNMVLPNAEFRKAANMVGHVNVLPDADDYIRWIPLVAYSPDETWLSLSAATYLSYLRISAENAKQVVKLGTNAVELTKQRVIPVDSSLRMLTNYFGGAGTFPTYSFYDVREGNVNPEVFKGKIVFIGMMNATVSTDRYPTPIAGNAESMAGVEIHAHAVETLLQNRPLRMMTLPVRALLLTMLSFIAGMVFAHLRWQVVLIALPISLVGFFVFASVMFSTARIVTDPKFTFLIVGIAAGGTLINDLRHEVALRSRLQVLLDSVAALNNQQLVIADTVRRIADDTRRLLPAPHAAVWVRDEDNDSVELAYSSAPHEQTNPLSSAAVETSRSSQEIIRSQFIMMPLPFQDRTIGAIAAFYAEPTGRFTEQQIDLLRRYTEKVSGVVVNSLLYTTQIRRRELLETTLSGVPQPLLVLDSTGRIVRTNDAATDLFELSRHDTLPSLRTVLEKGGLEQSAIQDAVTALGTQQPFVQDMQIGVRKFTMHGAPLSRTHTGYILVLNDVTALQDLNMMKTQMIRMASHDLKNPLTTITAYLEMLATITEEEKDLYQTYLDECQNAARQMQTIIDSILNLERLRAASLALQPVDLNELVQQAVGPFRAQAAQKSQAFLVQVAEAPLLIGCEASQMVEALSNLVSNAIKYTPNGGVIRISVIQRETTALIEVVDTGYGIPKAAQAKIFSPFFRSQSNATLNIPGTGLGLNLVKYVVERHKGHIHFTSEEGKGTTFFVELPLWQNTFAATGSPH